MKGMKRALLVLMIGCISLLGGQSWAQPAPEQTVDIIQVEGAIDPQISEYLRARLAGAQDDGVHAAVIQLDTPGGLDISMREIVTRVAFRVPETAGYAKFRNPASRYPMAGVFVARLKDGSIRVLVANLMTEAGETDHFGVLEHLLTIERHLGRQLFDWMPFGAPA